MAEQPIPKISIEAGPKEEELAEIKEKIEGSAIDLEKEKTPEKEQAIKEQIKQYVQQAQPTDDNSQLPLSKRDEAREIKKFPEKQQINALISLVFEKGLKQAVSVARSIDNPAVLDEFHDVLIDRYFDELIKRKIIKF